MYVGKSPTHRVYSVIPNSIVTYTVVCRSYTRYSLLATYVGESVPDDDQSLSLLLHLFVYFFVVPNPLKCSGTFFLLVGVRGVHANTEIL